MKEFIFDLQRFVEIENIHPSEVLEGSEDADKITNSGSIVTITRECLQSDKFPKIR